MKKQKVIIFLLTILIIFSGLVNAKIKIENKTINFDLEPNRITGDTYLPIEKLVDVNLFEVDKINMNRYIILKNNNYYILQKDKKIVKSNLKNRKLSNVPIVLNQHFLVPVEFLKEILYFNVSGDFGISDGSDQGNKNKAENLRIRVYLNDDDFDRSDTLKTRIEIMNVGNDDQQLRFNSARKYNIYIKNEYGNTIYSWGEGKWFSQSVQNIRIGSGNSIKFEENITLGQFNEGDYYLVIEILSENYDFSTIERQFEIDD